MTGVLVAATPGGRYFCHAMLHRIGDQRFARAQPSRLDAMYLHSHSQTALSASRHRGGQRPCLGSVLPSERVIAAATHATRHAPRAFVNVSRAAIGRQLALRVVAAQQATEQPAWQHQPLDVHSVVLKAGNTRITLETGEIGRQASGSIMATCGETMLYTTACFGAPAGDGSFVPLTVNYQEKFSAAGRTNGGFIKRDGRPKDADVLVSRLVDRPLRPMFKSGWSCETQVLEWVMSYDGVNPPEPLAITAAGAALLVSEIPFDKAVAGVRVAYVNDTYIINPTVQEQQRSSLDLIVAGTRDAILMIEGYCNFLTEQQMLAAVEVGHAAVASMCVDMEAWAKSVGKAKTIPTGATLPESIVDKVHKLVGAQLKEAYLVSTSKHQRSTVESAAEATVMATLLPAADGPHSEGAPTAIQLSQALKKVKSAAMREVVLEHGRRMDGRQLTDIRPIKSKAGLLSRTHGSVLFTRGETQALCVTTLGSKADALRAGSMRDEEDEQGERFYLQYFFPPSSVGETGRLGGAGRRELGHGELAQRALAPIVPSESSFPYTVRVESNITESNGSSSMASVCGGCLSMMDAGVPIVRPVAGIAMGLILEPDGRFSVLSDILGSEDALGDMDFKVAGDEERITAFQMDIKVEGITLDIMRKALAQAGDGRRHILQEMAKCSPPPRLQLSNHAPRVLRLSIDPTKKGVVIGSGGRTINAIKEQSGASAIDIDEDGKVEVMASKAGAAEMAAELIGILVNDPPTGKIFRSKRVVSVQPFGAFVELSPGREGLLHVNQLDVKPVSEVGTVVSVGDLVDVMVLDCANGKISLSRKAVLMHDNGTPMELGREAGEARPRSGDRGLAGTGAGRGAGRGGMSGGRGRGGGRRP